MESGIEENIDGESIGMDNDLSNDAIADMNGDSDSDQELESETHHGEMNATDSEEPWNDKPNDTSKSESLPTESAPNNGNSIIRKQTNTQQQAWTNNQYPNGNIPQLELWVEAKTEDGKSYFYHALTRETTWTMPVGPNVKVMTQLEIEEMNKKQQPIVGTFTPAVQNKLDAVDHMKEATGAALETPLTTQPPPNMLSQPPPTLTQQPMLNQPPPNVAATTGPPPTLTQQPPPMVRQHPPPLFQPAMHQPNFGQPPFGMPPPAYGFPGGPAPWGMPPWNQQQQQQHMHAPPVVQPQQQHDKPAKNLILKPGVIDPAVIARAAEWSEHRAPDGRPYYYHAARGESVWEKPQALRDMEAARMAAHSGVTATPQQPVVPQQQPSVMTPGNIPPHLLPNPMMHMPPGTATNAYDPNHAYAAAAAAAAAAASLKANENSKAAQAAALEKEAKKAAEEKRKKEEEQKKAAAAAKPVDKSRPISSTPIAGTPWCVVWTGDARVFFYNPSTRTSVWERPEDLLEREDVDKAVNNPPEQLKSLLPQPNAHEKVENVGNKPKIEPAVTSTTMDAVQDDDDDEVIKIRTESESSVEEVPSKKPRITAKSKKSDASEAAVEAEVRAAKERALVPLDKRVKQFKDMLREKDVSAFSTWEKELHKIVFDPRYLLLTSKERKQVFEKYVKDRAEEERKEKRNKMRQKRDDFRKLMEDAKLHGKSSFSEFCQRHTKDERFRSIEKVRERESLFNEFIVEVRRREKEDKIHRKEQIRKDFLEMLRERSDIDRHTRWHDIKKKFETDSRYRSVESSSYREEYFQDYVRIVKDEKRKQREQKEQRERERDRERKSERKSDRKDKDRSGRSDRSRSRDKERRDSRDRDDKRSKKDDERKTKRIDESDHEDVKRSVDDEKDRSPERPQRSDSDEDAADVVERENEAERAMKDRERQLRAELSIREREKEVQRTLAGHMRDRDKEREHHKRDEAIGHFNALLVDLVRNPDYTWKEVKRQLRKDHRWEMIETLDREDREKIFNEHIDNLMKKKREKFREMLDEISTLELTSSWKDIKKQIKDDPRFLKYNNTDKCEREYRDYIKDKTLQAKTALRELLHECKFITHKSVEMIKENPNHYKEVQDILKNDKRFLILEHLNDERHSIVFNYLEELHKRGPPPPPTASESTRRNK